MNIYFLKFLLLLSLVLTWSCEDNKEKYNGSPVGKAEFVPIVAVLKTNETSALPGQEIEYTVDLPASFRSVVTDSVAVETTSFSPSGSIRRSKLIFKPGVASETGKILIAGGTEIFENQIEMKVTAIFLYKPLLGKQFTASSNVINLSSGNSVVPSENSKKMRIGISWENKTVENFLKCNITRVNSVIITFKGLVPNATNKYPINFKGVNNVTAGVNIDAVYNSNLTQSASDFAAVCNSNSILNAAGITCTSSGSSVYVNYGNVRPVVTCPPLSPTAANSFKPFGATRFQIVEMPNDGNFPAYFDFFNSEIITRTGAPLEEAKNNLFNPGEYLVSMGAVVTSIIPRPLETVGADIRFKIVLRLPTGEVKVFPGVFRNPQISAGTNVPVSYDFTPIFKFKKTGLGDNAVFSDFQMLSL